MVIACWNALTHIRGASYLLLCFSLALHSCSDSLRSVVSLAGPCAPVWMSLKGNICMISRLKLLYSASSHSDLSSTSQVGIYLSLSLSFNDGISGNNASVSGALSFSNGLHPYQEALDIFGASNDTSGSFYSLRSLSSRNMSSYC